MINNQENDLVLNKLKDIILLAGLLIFSFFLFVFGLFLLNNYPKMFNTETEATFLIFRIQPFLILYEKIYEAGILSCLISGPLIFFGTLIIIIIFNYKELRELEN